MTYKECLEHIEKGTGGPAVYEKMKKAVEVCAALENYIKDVNEEEEDKKIMHDFILIILAIAIGWIARGLINKKLIVKELASVNTKLEAEIVEYFDNKSDELSEKYTDEQVKDMCNTLIDLLNILRGVINK